MPHGDPVVHADRVELEGDAARLADALLHVPADLVQVDVAETISTKKELHTAMGGFPMSASVTPAAFQQASVGRPLESS